MEESTGGRGFAKKALSTWEGPTSLKGKAGIQQNAKKALSTWEGPTSLKEKAGVRVGQPVDASKFEKNA